MIEDDVRNVMAEQESPSKRKASGGVTRLKRIWTFLRNLPITRKRVFWAAVIVLVYFRPMLLPFIFIVLFWIFLIAYLTLGHDRFFEIIHKAWARFSKRFPKRAEALRAKADRFAELFDRALDYLPEAWADRLSLPDLSGKTAFDDQPDPFERLANDARKA